MHEDIMECENPWDVVRDALADWKHAYLRKVANTEVEFMAEIDPVLKPDSVRHAQRLFRTAQGMDGLFRSMRNQSMDAETLALVELDHPTKLDSQGLDARQLSVVQVAAKFSKLLEAALISHALDTADASSAALAERFDALFLSSHAQGRPSPIAEQYLKRAANLLLLGLEVECTVFCRAALESALKSTIDDGSLAAQGFNKPATSKEFTLVQLIDCAAKLKLFSKEDRERAHRLRIDGNNAIHPRDAEVLILSHSEPNAKRSMLSLAILLRRLSPLPV